MKELFETLFPEPDDPEILGGLTDFTEGEATRYFAGLKPDDCELVQWYLLQGIGPHGIERHIFELAKGYAVVDPKRKNKQAVTSAHTEVGRARRFLDVFLSSRAFFPKMDEFNVGVVTETGPNDHIIVNGWGEFSSREGPLNLSWHKKNIINTVLPLFPLVKAFLDDPNGAPMHFNQKRILKEFEERKDKPA